MFLASSDPSTTALLESKGVVEPSPIIYSASDLTRYAGCQFSVMNSLDRMLDPHAPRAKLQTDAMLERTASLGIAHEKRLLEQLKTRLGAGLVEIAEIPRAKLGDLPTVELRTQDTLTALRDGADAVYQGTFFDGRFLGFADFIIRHGSTDAYSVWDTKLARREKSTALLQIAAYADQLQRLAIPVAPTLHLALGSGKNPGRATADLVPLYRDQRRLFERAIDTHRRDAEPTYWGDPRYAACCGCETCKSERGRDVSRVALMTHSLRHKLRSAGITTVEELAETSEQPSGTNQATFDSRRDQARIQALQHSHGYFDEDGTEPRQVEVEVFDQDSLATIPPPSVGDLFFDFEGDPLWTETEGDKDWGLEYLFGLIATGPDRKPLPFHCFWADDRSEERNAFNSFMDELAEALEANPEMHVYHYAPYEKTALSRLAGEYGRSLELAGYLRDNVFIDLYKVVRNSLRVGQESYSIKKLEPLYMPEKREGVDNAADSIDVYVQYCAAKESGDVLETTTLKQSVLDYNEDDCESTWRLRDWLLSLKDDPDHFAAGHVEKDDEEVQPDIVDLIGLVNEWVQTLSTDERVTNQPLQGVLALSGAGGYYQRETAVARAQRYERIKLPIDEWSEEQNVFYVDSVLSATDWAIAVVGRGDSTRDAWTRTIEGAGHWGPGSSSSPNSFAPVYSKSAFDEEQRETLIEGGQLRGACMETYGAKLVETDDSGGFELQECLNAEEWLSAPSLGYPIAVNSETAIRTTNKEAAILAVQQAAARSIEAAHATSGPASEPELERSAIFDILLRRDPRLKSSAALQRARAGLGTADAITQTILDLDNSYVAVQGPPGTGKTYTGAHVVKHLVLNHGFKVGICAQSHKVAENFLATLTDPDDVALLGNVVFKKPQDSNKSITWTGSGGLATFRQKSAGGYVIGGTSFFFANEKEVPRGSLDLLVVDEAGQFGMADLIAASLSARNILLLGDPQQLPMVVQGSHPGGVDTAALSWLCESEPLLPERFGYFLDTTWRMHPDLCQKISTLSYAGQLGSQESVTRHRGVEGVKPGVHVNIVEHVGDTNWSDAEAAEVVRIVQSYIGRTWWETKSGSTTRKVIDQEDVIVVAPYNAQVNLIKHELLAVGLGDVLVGTADKMQGQDYPIAVISMTTSDVSEAPRGAAFVLSRNRINVAVSRARFATHIVRAPSLTEYLPSNPSVLADLGGFIGLCENPVNGTCA